MSCSRALVLMAMVNLTCATSSWAGKERLQHPHPPIQGAGGHWTQEGSEGQGAALPEGLGDSALKLTSNGNSDRNHNSTCIIFNYVLGTVLSSLNLTVFILIITLRRSLSLVFKHPSSQ
jgi:hypothetical protein